MSETQKPIIKNLGAGLILRFSSPATGASAYADWQIHRSS